MPQWKFTLDELKNTAKDFLLQYPIPRIFAFHGPMGTGKTTFIHALCHAMQVTSAVSSPTFSIINEYSSADGAVYHLDLYRLRNEEEAIRAGVEDCLYRGATCLVEWPERAPGVFPAGTIQVYMEALDEQTRLVQVADK